jgi:hypothetical protein
MKTILYTDMDAQVYRAEPGLSKHELDAFSVAPMLYKRKQEHKKTSKAMEMGTIIHSLVLEDRVEYAALPSDTDLRTKAGKEAYQQFREQHNGKYIISGTEEQMVLGVQEAGRTSSCSRGTSISLLT